jgi:hypothetical protein
MPSKSVKVEKKAKVAASRPLRLRVICNHAPPAEYNGQSTEFGLQDKLQALHPGVIDEDDALYYEAEVSVRRHKTDGSPVMGGPFVHGPSKAKFLYLGWRPAYPPQAAWIRRTKVSLSSISWALIEQAWAGGGVLQARISGIEVASAPLLGGGWHCVADASDSE